MKKIDFRLNKQALNILILTTMIVAFGCLMVFCASSYVAEIRYFNKYYFLNKQLIGAALGCLSMLFFSQIDYHKLIKFRFYILAVSIILLILVFVPGIGVEMYGSKRWLRLPGFTLQPSEIAKFVFVFMSAYYLSKNYNTIKSFKKFLPIVLMGCLFCLLVIAEPNMSITICIGMVMIIMLFIGGITKKQFASIMLPCAAAVPLLIVAEPYRMKRLTAFIDPWATPQSEGFQLIQSLYGLGSGGWFGVGLFCSRQKYLFLPFSESDFIFSVIVEELGFCGGLLLIFSITLLVVLLIKCGLNACDRFGCLLCVGTASVIAVQSLINIAVVTGSIPPTGVPLPLISSGSTSLVAFMSAIGICLSVSKQSCRTQLFTKSF